MAHRAVNPVPERKAELRNELGCNTALDGIIFFGLWPFSSSFHKDTVLFHSISPPLYR
jgi:hypothetical protein